jgi:hypothetical protein
MHAMAKALLEWETIDASRSTTSCRQAAASAQGLDASAAAPAAAPPAPGQAPTAHRLQPERRHVTVILDHGASAPLFSFRAFGVHPMHWQTTRFRIDLIGRW